VPSVVLSTSPEGREDNFRSCIGRSFELPIRKHSLEPVDDEEPKIYQTGGKDEKC
jgi:hypothetical protein